MSAELLTAERLVHIREIVRAGYVLGNDASGELLCAYESLVRQCARNEAAADSYRERLNVSEQALCDQRTLSQNLGNHLDGLSYAAGDACAVWERTPSASLHDIRTAMRALRKRLNAPNAWRSQLKEYREAIDAAVAELAQVRESGRNVVQQLRDLEQAIDAAVAELSAWVSAWGKEKSGGYWVDQALDKLRAARKAGGA